MVQRFWAESRLLLAVMFNLKRKWSIARGGLHCLQVLRNKGGRHSRKDLSLQVESGRGTEYRHHYKSETWPIILSETDSSIKLAPLHARAIYVSVPPPHRLLYKHWTLSLCLVHSSHTIRKTKGQMGNKAYPSVPPAFYLFSVYVSISTGT
jgi:hypothetical protein